MHRIATEPGDWQPGETGTVLVEQTPAPIVFLSAADTELQALAAAVSGLPPGFAAVRGVNLLRLQQQIAIDQYAQTVLAGARAIVLRLLGGRAYWSYGLEVVVELARSHRIALVVLPGDEQVDPELLEHSTAPLAFAHLLWQYCNAGGAVNLGRALQALSDRYLGTDYRPGPPIETPRVGVYDVAGIRVDPERPSVGVLFYRAHVLSANTAVIDALAAALDQKGLNARCLYVYSPKEPETLAVLAHHFRGIDCLINTTSFSLARLEASEPDVSFWEALDVPVLQAVLASDTEERWALDKRGLSPRDVAMNVALPEVDGRIISRAISFKWADPAPSPIESPSVTYRPRTDRVAFVAELACRWVRLRQTARTQRRIALVLANYPTRDGRLANGVGLDTPASCVAVLEALREAGYDTGESLPTDGDALVALLTGTVTNDLEGDYRPLRQWVDVQEYGEFFSTLSESVQTAVVGRWGLPPGNLGLRSEGLPVSGVRFGNVFVAIQPARGYDSDPALNYHAPDLEPPHPYFAFYHWLRDYWGAHAVVHLGKHGNLEWLPGKSHALSAECFPEAVFGPMPHLYPFIVNDPGEGAQAKRRAQAVIVDHLTPPMARAETYGALLDLENTIDEYHEALALDPKRLEVIELQLLALVAKTELHRDLGYPEIPATGGLAAFVTLADGYLCEIKEAQIRDGLHIFGSAPEGPQRLGLLVAIARSDAPGRPGLTQALALDLNLDLDPLIAPLGEPFTGHPPFERCRSAGDAVEQLELLAEHLVDALPALPADLPRTAAVLTWMADLLIPALERTGDELTHLLHGLDGGYVPSGPSGAPTRGRPEVLPTGRNFYSVDIRAIPTPSAWDVGRRAAEALIERHTQEHGEYPRRLGLSVWGTSTMRTGGDDLAEALALIGVQPVWDRASRRVVDFEVLPLAALGRPRVDVTLRVSGFFRDAFSNLIDLFQSAVEAVARQEEAAEENPLRAQVEDDCAFWSALPPGQAQAQSLYRVFGSKDGAYGAGLQGLIESQQWQDDADLARAYLNWSSYAYTGKGAGIAAPEAFSRRLSRLEVVLHNQDNREHDLLDSDDYYQFQGGMTAAVRALSGRQPVTYFGDNARPQNPKVRALTEEIARVYRSRVVNPKWIAGMMRHGYKGAFELSATVDYLFAYDATAHCVEDFMYQGVADSYLLDPAVQDFVLRKNPWVLRDMAERLLEAHQRGLWTAVSQGTIEQLRSLVLQAEAVVEQNNGAFLAES